MFIIKKHFKQSSNQAIINMTGSPQDIQYSNEEVPVSLILCHRLIAKTYFLFKLALMPMYISFVQPNNESYGNISKCLKATAV